MENQLQTVSAISNEFDK